MAVPQSEFSEASEKQRLAKKMLAQRFPLHAIVRVTRLPEAVLQQLHQELLEELLQDVRNQEIRGSESTQAFRADMMAAAMRQKSTMKQPPAVDDVEEVTDYPRQPWSELMLAAS